MMKSKKAATKREHQSGKMTFQKMTGKRKMLAFRPINIDTEEAARMEDLPFAKTVSIK